MFYFIATVFLLIFPGSFSFPEQGIWNFNVDQSNNIVVVSKVAYKNSAVHIQVNCEASVDNPVNVSISYVILMLPCYERGLVFDTKEELSNMKSIHYDPASFQGRTPTAEKFSFWYLQTPYYTHTCAGPSFITLESITADHFKKFAVSTTTSTPTATTIFTTTESKGDQAKADSAISQKDVKESAQKEVPVNDKTKRDVSSNKDEKSENMKEKSIGSSTSDATTASSSTTVKTQVADVHTSNEQPQTELVADGVYIVSVLITPLAESADFKGSIDIKIRSESGYLSALDWPLLPFYGVMCIVYVMYGLVWLVVSACQWRDLLRIQFWIGGVLFLGMLEMAVFYAEYQSINTTGRSVTGAVISAEVVSCLKRTLARMVVIIVSLGFGIVKPRLGPLLHRVVGVGALYFILSVAEGIMRVYGIRNDPYRQFWIATIFLAVLDSFICWWIFTSLVQTTRTLRLRRNIVKLTLYRHFTNTLIFAVIASVAFMVWSLKAHQRDMCIADWKELWVDEAYWRFLFSVILLVIMILWRPTNNNQRYAFTPLLDAPDDEDEEQTVPESFEGMKMRGVKNQNHHSPKGVEDDLKWIDENIPSALSDVALPSLLDSDEEIMTTKFEMSKMN